MPFLLDKPSARFGKSALSQSISLLLFLILLLDGASAFWQLMNRGRVGLKRLQRWSEIDTEVSALAIQTIHHVAHILLVAEAEVRFVGEFHLLTEARGHEFEELDRRVGLELLATHQRGER